MAKEREAMSNEWAGDKTWFDHKIMRAGRKVKRTLYLYDADDATGDGWIIGLVDTPELAAEIVRRWNEE